MNKFTKWMCVIAGIAAGLGVLCMLLSFVMGLTVTGFAEMFKRGRFTFAFLGESHVKDDVLRTEEIEEGVVNIDVEFEAGELVFCYGDVRDIQIEYRNAPDLAWTCDEKTLHISENSAFDHNADVYLKITLPKNTTYEKIDLDIGASKAAIEDICAKKIDICVGAGKAKLKNLEAEQMALEVGAGELFVEDMKIETLDIECGVGKVDAEIYGVESDYQFRIDCAVGSVKIGDRTFGGIGAEYESDRHHENHHDKKGDIDIDCGIGEVVIQFTK